jgi:hypothetical protein
MDSRNDDKMDRGGWVEWAKYVLLTLEQHDEKIEKIKECQTAEQLKFETFKTKVETKSSNISAIVSVIVTIAVSIIIHILTNKL